MALLSRVGADERPRFLGASLGFMCVASASLIARTAGDTLFLSLYGRELLSYMYIGTAVVVGLLSYVYGMAAKKYALNWVIGFACALLAIFALGLWVGLLFPWAGFRVAAYFLGDITVYGSMLLFWSFFGQIFDSSEARRLIGIVGASGTVACIVAGFLIRSLTLLLGAGGLLIIVALLMLGFAGSVSYVSHHAQCFSQPKINTGVSNVGSFKHLMGMAQIRYLALLVLVGTVSVTLVDFQFKSAAQARYQNQQLAAFFGEFYGAANVIILVIQLFVVHRILRRFHLAIILSLLPAALLAGSVGTLVSAAFGWFVVTRFTVLTLAFTIDNAGLQMLFLGIRKKSCNQARAIVDGICKPVAIGATGVLLAAISIKVPVHVIAYGVVALSLAWLYLAHKDYVLYLQGLVDSLGAKMLDLWCTDALVYDQSIVIQTKEALLSAEPDDLPYLFSIVEALDQVDWTPEVRRLLESGNPDARTAALHHLEHHGSGEDYLSALSHVSDSEPEVRQAALGAAQGIGGRQAMAALSESLDDSDPGVRAEAAGRLFQLCDPACELAASTCVKQMMESADLASRIAVARRLGRLQFDGWKRLFLEFMRDPEKCVRVAAIEGCLNCRDPELIPSLICQLRDSATSAAAADALVAFGRVTLDFLRNYPNEAELRTLCVGAGPLAAVLVRIGGAEALNILSRLFDTPEGLDSAHLIETYCRLLDQQPSLRPYLASISKVASHEIAEAQRRLESLDMVSTLPGGDFLRQALKEEYHRHLDNVLVILDVRFPGIGIRNIHSRLLTGVSENRAAALEVLQNVLPRNFKDPILSLVEHHITAGKDRDGLSVVLEILKRESSEWVLVGAVYAAGENKMADAVEPMRRLLSHPSANVVETARCSLTKMGNIDPNGSQQQQAAREVSHGSECIGGAHGANEIIQHGARDDHR